MRLPFASLPFGRRKRKPELLQVFAFGARTGTRAASVLLAGKDACVP